MFLFLFLSLFILIFLIFLIRLSIWTGMSLIIKKQQKVRSIKLEKELVGLATHGTLVQLFFDFRDLFFFFGSFCLLSISCIVFFFFFRCRKAAIKFSKRREQKKKIKKRAKNRKEKRWYLSFSSISLLFHPSHSFFFSGLFPAPDDFLHWVHENGLKVTLNLHPASGVQPHELRYPQMAKAMGIDPRSQM